MRISSPFTFIWTILLCAMTSALVDQAQGQTTLIGITEGNWRYYQNGDEPRNPSQPGVSWTATNFNDTAWGQGIGVHGYEDAFIPYPIQTPLERFKPGSTTEQIIAYYFRGRFNYTGTGPVIFTFTNLLDDGAVVYLNGFEIYRYRMTGNPPGSNTQATAPAVGNAVIEINEILNPTGLRLGENVLAVQVHQQGTGSSDLVFGLGLSFSLPDAINIVQHPPAKVEAVEGDSVVLSVTATGTNPRYWWFRNNQPTGQDSPTLTINNITLSQAGTYHCVVSNSFSGARSSNSVVTVVPDTFGPRIERACVLVGDTNRVFVYFNEPLSTTTRTNVFNNMGMVVSNVTIRANDTNNYVLTILGQPTNRVPVSAVAIAFGLPVRLTLSTNINTATNYQLCVNNIADSRGNGIALNSCVPICFEAETNIFGFSDPWLYNEWAESLDNTNWTSLSYTNDRDPILWSSGNGVFFGSFAATNNACVPVGTLLSVGTPTVYFRKTFIVPTNLLGLKLQASFGHTINDGAIFYLNGTEVFRHNLPDGPVPFGTLAPSANANICRTNTIQDLVFTSRTNILAVALHQNNSFTGGDSTIGFGCSLDVKYDLTPRFVQPTNIVIRITNDSATQFSMLFTNGLGYTFQRTTNLGEPWREVQPPTNRLVWPKTNPRQFFRLKKTH